MEFVNSTNVEREPTKEIGPHSQSPTLLFTMGDAIHWLLMRWSMLLVYFFLSSLMIHSMILALTIIVGVKIEICTF
jgi:hypothetical protein